MTEKIEFINDWKKLEAAVAELTEWLADHDGCDPDYCDLPVDRPDFKPIIELVPRLIKAYEDLWDKADAMLTAWEAYVKNQSPAGLYLPPMNAPGTHLTARVTAK